MALWAVTTSSGRAAFTENIGVGVVATSLGNAVTADPFQLEALHFNPAGLSRLKGNQWQRSAFAAQLGAPAEFRAPADFDVGGWSDDPVAGKKTGPSRALLYIPGLGTVKNDMTLPAVIAGSVGISLNEAGSPWVFAAGLYPTQSVNLDRTTDPNDPGRFDGRQIVLQRLVYAAPAFAYKVSDSLSFGITVPLAHQTFKLNTDMRFPNKLLGIIGKVQEAWCSGEGNPVDVFAAGLCAGGAEGMLRPFNKVGGLDIELSSSMDPTINLGVLWEPSDQFALGGVYQSGSRVTLAGKYSVNAEPMLRKFVAGLNSSLLGPIIGATVGFPSSIAAEQHGNATVQLPFAEHVQVGLKIKPIQAVQLNMDLSWANWKRWDKITIQFDQSVGLIQMARLFGQIDPTKLVIRRGYRNTLNPAFGLQLEVTKDWVLRAGYEPRKSSISEKTLDLLVPLPDLKMLSLGTGIGFSNGTRLDITASRLFGNYHIPPGGSCNLNCNDFSNVIYNPYAGLDVRGSLSVKYLGLSFSSPF